VSSDQPNSEGIDFAAAAKEGALKFDENLAMAMVATGGHGGHLGMEYGSHGDDWAELYMDWRADLVADEESGIFASSAVISLLDNATSLSIWAKLGHFRPQVTMDLRIDYLRPSPMGERIYGRGECYRITKNVSFVRGIAHNGDVDDPLAHAAGTFLRVLPQNMVAK